MAVAFVSNRGGSGKSTLAAQLGALCAQRAPGTQVLVLDCSIQASASEQLLGGCQEPLATTAGVATRGWETLKALDPAKTAAGLLEAAAREADADEAAPPAAGWFGWMSPKKAPAKPAPLDWAAHAVRGVDAYPAGGAPPNLFLAAGGEGLLGAMGAQTREAKAAAARVAVRLRACFARAGPGLLVLIDTDAEVSERLPSLVGLAAAARLVVLTSTHWPDTTRLFTDKVNGLFHPEVGVVTGLAEAANAPPAEVACVVFNKVQLTKNEPAGGLPFTAPAATQQAVRDIMAYLEAKQTSPRGPRFAAVPGRPFFDAHVTALRAVPDTGMQRCLYEGQPLCAAQGRTAPEQGALDNLAAVGQALKLLP